MVANQTHKESRGPHPPPKNANGVHRNKSSPFKQNIMDSTHLGESKIHYKTKQQERFHISSFYESKEQPSTPSIKGIQRNMISTLWIYAELRGHYLSPGMNILPSNLTNRDDITAFCSFLTKLLICSLH